MRFDIRKEYPAVTSSIEDYSIAHVYKISRLGYGIFLNEWLYSDIGETVQVFAYKHRAAIFYESGTSRLVEWKFI